ncbi:uncharacterized protein TNCV_3960361 [Trichonephila clavipes]|nr:uncharacterized protein TNCV_3960361 [Trichonephila clavipes]
MFLIVPSWHGGTLTNHRADSPLVRLVEKEVWEDPDHPHGVLPQNWGGTEPNHTVTCMVLKTKANDRKIITTIGNNFVLREEKCLKLHSSLVTSHCSATRVLLETDHVILNHGQVTWMTHDLAPPLLTTTPHQRENVSALDRFNVHLCSTRRVFSGTGLELMTRQSTIRNWGGIEQNCTVTCMVLKVKTNDRVKM